MDKYFDFKYKNNSKFSSFYFCYNSLGMLMFLEQLFVLQKSNDKLNFF